MEQEDKIVSKYICKNNGKSLSKNVWENYNDKKLLIESSTENIIIESNYDGWERK